jgi:DnaA family protein
MSETPQIPLGFGAPPHLRLAGFVAGDNAAALDAVAAVGQGRSDAWLYLAGPPASGKSHLLAAACHEAAARGAQYLPLARLGAGAEEALIALAPRPLVAVDDVEVVAGRLGAEIALFDAYNRVRDAGGVMLLAARHRPGLLGLALPDLASRLAACTLFELALLGEAERRAVFLARAAERGLSIDDGVLEFLFRRHARDLGALLALLDRIDRESLAAQRRVTVPFVRRLIAVPPSPP